MKLLAIASVAIALSTALPAFADNVSMGFIITNRPGSRAADCKRMGGTVVPSTSGVMRCLIYKHPHAVTSTGHSREPTN